MRTAFPMNATWRVELPRTVTKTKSQMNVSPDRIATRTASLTVAISTTERLQTATTTPSRTNVNLAPIAIKIKSLIAVN